VPSAEAEETCTRQGGNKGTNDESRYRGSDVFLAGNVERLPTLIKSLRLPKKKNPVRCEGARAESFKKRFCANRQGHSDSSKRPVRASRQIRQFMIFSSGTGVGCRVCRDGVPRKSPKLLRRVHEGSVKKKVLVTAPRNQADSEHGDLSYPIVRES
jgi:hypothetical protein